MGKSEGQRVEGAGGCQHLASHPQPPPPEPSPRQAHNITVPLTWDELLEVARAWNGTIDTDGDGKVRDAPSLHWAGLGGWDGVGQGRAAPWVWVMREAPAAKYAPGSTPSLPHSAHHYSASPNSNAAPCACTACTARSPTTACACSRRATCCTSLSSAAWCSTRAGLRASCSTPRPWSPWWVGGCRLVGWLAVIWLVGSQSWLAITGWQLASSRRLTVGVQGGQRGCLFGSSGGCAGGLLWMQGRQSLVRTQIWLWPPHQPVPSALVCIGYTSKARVECRTFTCTAAGQHARRRPCV